MFRKMVPLQEFATTCVGIEVLDDEAYIGTRFAARNLDSCESVT